MRIGFVQKCKEYDLSLWQCPQFLFILMGGINILSCLASYFLGQRYISDPRLVSLIVLALALVLLMISYIITRSLENLAEVNRLKEEFANVVSHQLRAPLTNINWVLNFILENDSYKKLAREQSSYFEILQENVNRMENLINDLLIVSRIKQSKAFKKEDFLFDKLLEEVISGFRALAQASNISIQTNIPHKSIKVHLPKNLIKVVLENLIDNSIRYNRSGGKVIIEVKRSPTRVYFKIQDTGIGIPKEEQKLLFQKFFRTRNALEKDPRGSGLGLFIVKGIIQKLGGKIKFRPFGFICQLIN